MLICLTGKTGSGKSTCLEIIKKLGYQTFETDNFIHDIYQVNQAGYELIKQEFGEIYVNEKEVDRKRLGQLVFNHKEQLEKLNKLMLPIIKEKIVGLKQKQQIIFVELAIYLNHESYFTNLFDEVIQVTGKSEQEEEKVKKLSWFSFKKKQKNPIKSTQNSKYHILFNTGPINTLEPKIKHLIGTILKKQF